MMKKTVRNVELKKRCLLTLALAAATSVFVTGCATAGAGEKKMDAQATGGKEAMQQAIHKMQSLNQTRGYIDAHKGVEHPLTLLGGPIEIKASQDVGGVHVALPAHRQLDPTVFGPPDLPRHYAGTPMITGVPPMLREKTPDGGYQTKVLTPFGNKSVVMGGGKLMLDSIDATATDAARSADSVKFSASWQDKSGNTYSVKCCGKLATHGLEYPTYGGVWTNGIMHGFTGIGTPLMPSEYTYYAFWGMGQVEKNGKVLDKPRLVHVMLTEYVRGKDYRLAWDKDVTPTRTHLHLMVPPFKPDMKDGVFVKSPVKTGMTLPNGKALPFWHVMFSNLTVKARRTESGWVSFPEQLK
ncbi:MAG TPA: hypothetical protein VKA32_00925 [Gammaproteobacteria bacterium]|nr:hypothetical protein [Gammaproteobacteria bacterium]